VIDAWLSPMNVETFLRTHLQKVPLARPGAATIAVPLFQWSTFETLFQSTASIDLLTVDRGMLVDTPSPLSLRDVRQLLHEGVSVVVRGAERNVPALTRLTDGFSARLPGEVHAQLYATPAGTHSYGWHYDFEDVFIVQTAGVKDYYFRENTTALDARLGGPMNFEKVRQERSPLFCSRLQPGDWLYLPSRWWHFVTCVEESLSISVGVMPPEAAREAVRVPRGWVPVAR